MKKAIFLDKDGTLIADVPYNINLDLIRLENGAVEFLKSLKSKGYLLIMVSNQSGIAHGYFDEGALENLKVRLQELFHSLGVALDAFFFCPHHPDGKVARYAIACNCRKPSPGMILDAASIFNIDLRNSWMIGDILHDVEAGNRAGCRTILINNGHETEWQLSAFRTPTVIVESLSEAADTIIQEHERELV